jgi:hypothetical protein
MANGGAVQLTLTGVQNLYLNVGAKTGFFDSQHITYEDFAMESIAVDAMGNMDFGKGCKFKFTGAAELAAGAYIETTLPDLTAPPEAAENATYYIAWCHSVGIYLFKSIEFNVNNTRVDVHYPQYIDLMGRLTIGADKREGYNDMIGELNIHTRFSHNGTVHTGQVDPDAPQKMAAYKPRTTVYMPLKFWWCNDYSQSLPVGLLLFSDIYVSVEYQEANKLYLIYEEDISAPGGDIVVNTSLSPVTKPSIVDSKLYVDYVYMSNASRDRISNQASFYLIKQVRGSSSVPISSGTLNHRLSFVMPVTTLIYGVQEDGAVADDVKRYDWWDRYHGNHNELNEVTPVQSQLPDSPIATATLKILGTERFSPRGWMYWSRITSWRPNTVTPSTRGVFVYHFSLHPEEHLGSGAINLSRSDNNYLYLETNRSAAKISTVTTPCGIGSTGITGQIYIYAENYNYLYVDGGYISVLYNV